MSLVNTVSQDIRANYKDDIFDWPEHRLSNYGALQMAIDDTEGTGALISSKTIATAKANDALTVSLPALNKADISFGSAESCTLPTFENTSVLVDLTWTPYQWGLSMVPTQYGSNDIDYQTDLEKKILHADRKFNETLDTSVLTVAEANKSAVLDSVFLGDTEKYGNYITLDEVTVSAALTPLYLNDLSSIMEENDFFGRFNVVGNSAYKSQLDLDRNQGAGNSQNTSFQFGEYNFYFTNRLVPGATNNYATYTSPRGTWSIFNRNRQHHRENMSTTDGTEYGTSVMPTTGWDVGVTFRSTCSDQSAIHGGDRVELTATVIEQWSFYTEVCIATPYVDTPASNAYPIVKSVFTVA